MIPDSDAETWASDTWASETWASETSDNLRVIGGLTAGSSYTATVMAEGASESVEFVTGADHDQSAPDMLGETYEEDSGNYRLSFYTTEPSSIVIEVCTNTSCTLPATGDSTGISIFIDSRIINTSPSATSVPALT